MTVVLQAPVGRPRIESLEAENEWLRKRVRLIGEWAIAHMDEDQLAALLPMCALPKPEEFVRDA